jgi:hypothetical protein
MPYSQKHSDRFWAPRKLLFSGHRKFFLGKKRHDFEFGHSSPSIAEVKNEWSYTSTPTTFMPWSVTTFYLFKFLRIYNK